MNKKILFLITFISCQVIFSQAIKSLKFDADGELKIVQFTDLHLDNEAPKYSETLSTIRSVVSAEKPDFVVVTGDVVTGAKTSETWQILAQTIESFNISWTVTFGNHDEEQNMSKIEIFDLLKTFPNFVGEKGNVTGVGNFAIPILGKNGREAAILYFFDSHDYTRNPIFGKYDWMKFDQLQWYRNQSEKWASQNNGKSLPALAFFHIPLPEYEAVRHSSNTLGNAEEGVSSPEINAGFLASFIEKRDVMATFVGHDHNNNYIGIHRDIALAYGNCTGSDAYGHLPRGGRVIVMKEGQRSFETWIYTPEKEKENHFYYPSGLGKIQADTHLMKAENIRPTRQGIAYRYYEGGKIRSVNEISKMKLKNEGILSEISIKSATAKDHFAFVFLGYIQVPNTAFYRFHTYSDDGSVLKIGGQIVVDNDGGHGARRREGIIALEKGFHKIEVLYFEDYMGEVLDVGVSAIHQAESKIPAEWLFVSP